MAIHVEFYGIARHRAGVAQLEIEIAKSSCTLADVLTQVEQRLPALRGDCITDGRLTTTLSANLNGDQFISDPDTPIPNGASLLIVSADAGG
jgi:molybdopterin converting factor small subunit